MQRFRTVALILTMITALFALPAVAAAQESAGDAYGGQGQIAGSVSEPTDDAESGIAPSVGGGNAPTAAAPSSSATANTADPVSGSELPFTGFDAGLVAVGGLALLALGLGIRRLSRDPAASA